MTLWSLCNLGGPSPSVGVWTMWAENTRNNELLSGPKKLGFRGSFFSLSFLFFGITRKYIISITLERRHLYN